MRRNLPVLVAKEFSGVDLGDRRLSKRCGKLAKGMALNPEKSLPKALEDWAQTKAAYRFLSNENVTREKLLKPHIAQTALRGKEQGVILTIQDTTYLNFSDHKATEGLGWIGRTEVLQGLVVHSTLAVGGEDREVLGLLHQEVWAREEPMAKDEKSRDRRNRPRESERWVRGIAAVDRLSLKRHVIAIFDREGDIYEALGELDRTKQGFVIRAAWNRRLVGEAGHLFDAVRSAPELGTMEVHVPAKAGRAARTAQLVLRSVLVSIKPPRGAEKKAAAIETAVVQAVELNPPAGIEALEWVLLTREAHQTLEECIAVVRYYTARWKIEEFHIGLKTGCRIEERQLKTRAALEAFLGFCDLIAVMLLRLRDSARRLEQRPASEILSPIQLRLLSKKNRRLPADPNAREALRAIAQLGGFLARKSDGEPGWRTLWCGMQKLLLMEQGYLLATTSGT